MKTTCPVCNSIIDGESPACPFCGFKLLGTTQQFQPLSLDEDLMRDHRGAAPRASLRVLRGPQTGIVFQLKRETARIGRSPKSDIFLNDMTVSREHADIVPFEDGFEIVDRNSFNGVWVNNENVERRALNPGDVIQIGAFLLLYQVG